MNIMNLKGYSAKIEFDSKIDSFRGEILGLNGGADFYGRTPEELRKEFETSLNTFLEVCREKGIPPIKAYSGKFNLRMSKDLHSKISIEAASEGKSINQWVVDILANSIE